MGNMPKKIAVIGTRGYPSFYGGFETAVRKLAPYLAENGWEVTVFGRQGSIDPDFPERALRVNSVITPGFRNKSLSTLSHGFSATLNASRNKYDVALIMNVANGFWLPILKVAKIPTLVNVDGIEWQRSKWGWFAKNMFRFGAFFTAKFADFLIFDSIEIERRWAVEFNVSGAYIPYGGEHYLKKEPINPGLISREYVLFVARFVPENSTAIFFEAVKIIAETTAVVIVGSSGFQDDFDTQAMNLANAYANVTWLGHINNDELLHNLWANAGIYFHGHTVGGTNPALVQAMACGAPVLAVDTAYNREVLGDSGAYTTPDPETIAFKILSIIKDKNALEDMSIAAITRASHVYTWEKVNEAYLLLLDEAINFRRAD